MGSLTEGLWRRTSIRDLRVDRRCSQRHSIFLHRVLLYECGRGVLRYLTRANTNSVYSLCIRGVIRLVGGSRVWPTGYILGISRDYVTSTALLGSGTLHSPPLGALTARHLIVYITY